MTDFRTIEISARPDCDELLSRQARRKIFFNVLAGHIIFFLIPFIVFYIQSLIPKEKIIKVNLVNLPVSEQKSVEKAVEKVKEKVKKPDIEPLKEPQIPKPPTPPEPKVEPLPKVPEPKITPPKIPEPTVKPVPIPEPTITPVKITEPKKNIEKPPEIKQSPEPPKEPKKSFLKPEEIKISKEVVKVSTPQSRPVPQRPKINADDIIKGLKTAVRQQQVSATATSNSVSNIPRDYYDTVSSYLYGIWRQPMKAELGGRMPKVKVELKVDGRGNVLSSRIISASGITAMDASVNELLGRLKSIPAPPDGRAMEMDVVLEIVD